MQECKKTFWGGVLGSLILLVAAPDLTLATSTQVKIDNRTDLIHYSISGLGKAASFYDDGSHVLHETDIRAASKFDNGWDSTFNLNFRLTDNDQFDPESASIEKMNLKLTNGKIRFDIGDQFANFSQYSMNKSIKGLGGQVNFKDKENYLRMAYGIFDSQWEYLYQSPDSEPMDRFGGGVRFQHSREKYRIGLNLSHVMDDEDDKNRNTEDSYVNVVPALDWEYRQGSFKLNGEHAYSDTEVTTSTGTETDTSDSAHRLGFRTRIRAVKLQGKYERVGTDFTTLGGGATPDRQRIYAKADTKINKYWSVFGVFNHSSNNLDDDDTMATTTNITGEVGVKRKRAFKRRSMNISLSARRKWTDTDDNSRESTSDRIKFGVSDRFFKVVRFNGDIETIIDDDTTAGGSSSSNYFYNLSLSSRHSLKDRKLELRPRLYFGLQERENLTTNGDDTTVSLKFNLGATYLKKFRFGMNAERVENDLSANGDDSVRTKLGAYCEVRPEWLKNGSIRLEGASNDYNFDDNQKDYHEDIVKLMFRYSFEKKWGN